jgi:hypothetical protein
MAKVHAAPLRLAACCAVLAILLPAAERERKKSAPAHAVIAGTVFQDSGFSLSGAEIKVLPAEGDGSARDAGKGWQTTSDARGEFAVRVPAGAARYTVRAGREGWQSAEKAVSIQWDERVDLVFRLSPAVPGEAPR